MPPTDMPQNDIDSLQELARVHDVETLIWHFNDQTRVVNFIHEKNISDKSTGKQRLTNPSSRRCYLYEIDYTLSSKSILLINTAHKIIATTSKPFFDVICQNEQEYIKKYKVIAIENLFSSNNSTDRQFPAAVLKFLGSENAQK